MRQITRLSPVTTPRPAWAARTRHTLAPALLCAASLLSACGGGGGGNPSASNASVDTSQTVTTSDAAFPIGMTLASPVAMLPASEAVAGAMGVSTASVSPAMAPAQTVQASQVDAVATGRLSLATTPLLSADALFDTHSRSDASCYGPAVAYLNHDDAPGTDGRIDAGQVGLWADTDGSQACAAAQVQARAGHTSAQVHQAALLLAGLRHLIDSSATLALPTGGSTVNLLDAAATWLSPLLTGVSVQAASLGLNGDGTEYTYRLVLGRGAGASAQSIELKLLHNPGEIDTRYGGTLQIALAYLSSDATIGCGDLRDSAQRYKVARLTTVGYFRQDEWLTLRTRSGQYCGHPRAAGGDHIGELATLAMSGELDPAVHLGGGTRGSTLGWRQGFVRLSVDTMLDTSVSDFMLAWQDQPLGGLGQARLLAGHSALDTSAHRTLDLFHGLSDDISLADGTLRGTLCQAGGPGTPDTVLDLVQHQRLSLPASATSWALASSHIRYAPTHNCQASATMSFDLDGNGSASAGEGSGFGTELLAPRSPDLTVEDEMRLMGYTTPFLLL